MTKQKVYFLSKVEFLSDLNAQELSELARDFHWEEYAKGSDIIHQGEDCHRFYVLAEGKAEAVVAKSGHSSVHLNFFLPGETFGEISLVSSKPSPSTVRCVENCKVLVLEAEGFGRMLARWPRLYQRFIEKLSRILNQVNEGLWQAKHKEFLRSALQLTQYEYKFYGLWGSAKTTKEVELMLSQMSQSKEHVLIIGERGTGRQMMAWFLHKRRFGEAAPFVVVDGRLFEQQWAGSLSEANAYEENLPIVRGGSILDVAEGGTLLIRDIEQMSPRAQLRLGQILQKRENSLLVVGSLGSNASALVPELKACFGQTYTITPLRQRKRDIPVIAQGVLEKLAQQNNRKTPSLNQEATKLLLSHNYRQGNVTELIRTVERAFYLAESDVIGLEHVFFGPTAEKIGRTINLLSWPWIENLLKKSDFILWLQRITTGVFALIVLLLLLIPKTTLGSALFVLVWGLWWPALAIISPFLGRVWCTVCPFSFIMEWVQKRVHLNKPVPDFIKKYDHFIITFLFLLVFWTESVTHIRFNTLYTVILLACIQGAAILTGIIFVRHTWCRHLCPLGGFVGMASIGGMLEVRADATYCTNKCTTYECYKGNGQVEGCPMFQHAPFVDNSLACKVCFHCVRNCPNGAVKVNLRVPAREVWHLVRVNQGFAVFIGASLAILFPINYFESLYQVMPLNTWRLWFSAAYWGSALAAGALIWLIAQPFRTKGASRRVKLVFALIPTVLAGHIIYQLHFVPGANSVMLGFGMRSAEGVSQAVYFPAMIAGQVLALMIGLSLTGLSAFMVWLRTRDKPGTPAVPLDPGPEQKTTAA